MSTPGGSRPSSDRQISVLPLPGLADEADGAAAGDLEVDAVDDLACRRRRR